MEKSLKTVAFIPVRGGSKSIPLKNIKTIAGKPLVQWVLEAASQCELIDKIYVSTDSSEIREVVNTMKISKVEVIKRSEESATDVASSEFPLLEFAEKKHFHEVVFIQATSPLLTSVHLSEAIQKFHDLRSDSLLSVVRQKRFIWQEEQNQVASPVNYDPLHRPRRQDFDGYLVENGAFYITSREQLLKSRCRISGTISYYEMPAETYVELDEHSDWKIVETLLLNSRASSNRQEVLRNIKLLVTDCDGVLTDGGMYYTESGDELKKFHTRDGMGIGLLQQNGIKVAIITGENTQIVRNRAAKLGIDILHLGVKEKLPLLKKMISELNVSLDQVAYIGDDINDLEVIRNVGFGVAVANAMPIVLESAHYVTKTKGGEGAVRELADMILEAQMM